MKAALIPPISALKEFGSGDFHLLLSHLLEFPRYRHHYWQERCRGAYLVLDNAAHEIGEGEDSDALRVWALEMRVQEVVVPDVLFDASATVQRALDTLEIWFESVKDQRMFDLNPALMYVPQGKDEVEWKRCLTELVDLHTYMARRKNFRRDFVIGLSKDYETWEGGLCRIVRDHLDPLRQLLFDNHEIKMNVHMLGWGRDLWALRTVAREYPWVRSTDSAKPFVYALKKKILNPSEDPPEYPTRPDNYFHRRLNDAQADIASVNVTTYLSTARGLL